MINLNKKFDNEFPDSRNLFRNDPHDSRRKAVKNFYNREIKIFFKKINNIIDKNIGNEIAINYKDKSRFGIYVTRTDISILKKEIKKFVIA